MVGVMKCLPPSPVLPLDLERTIVEMSARSRPVLIPKFMLVAWRVKEWVEPLLYHTIAVEYSRAMDGYPIFTWEVLIAALDSKPFSFFHLYVRNLCLLTSTNALDVEILLNACTGVENLSVTAGSLGRHEAAIASSITLLPLTHLTGNFGPIFRNTSPDAAFFTRITHLGLRAGDLLNKDTELGSRLTSMPHLSHLSFGDTRFVPLLLPVRTTSQSLRVLISLGASARSKLGDLPSDPRFVALFNTWQLGDWQMGAHAGVDYWTRAENFIAKRRSGEINALEYEIPDDASLTIAYSTGTRNADL
ncbi:hypothetical protein DFH06DRAFT_1481813 [Mycena polygramma]|nr:hypothetical protein DFH06DRAFT_1481813 [Mycena polygramma]